MPLGLPPIESEEARNARVAQGISQGILQPVIQQGDRAGQRMIPPSEMVATAVENYGGKAMDFLSQLANSVGQSPSNISAVTGAPGLAAGAGVLSAGQGAPSSLAAMTEGAPPAQSDFLDALSRISNTVGAAFTGSKAPPPSPAQQKSAELGSHIANADADAAAGKPPSAEDVTAVVVESTVAKAEGPVSDEKRAEITKDAKALVARQRPQDRIDMLQAGLAILQGSADGSKSTGSIIAGGLMHGLHAATAAREKKFANEIDTHRANSARIAANAAMTRAANPTRAAYKATAGDKALATQVATQLSAGDETAQDQLDALLLSGAERVGGMPALMGNPQALQALMQEANAMGINFEANSSLWGMVQSPGISSTDNDPGTANATNFIRDLWQ